MRASASALKIERKKSVFHETRKTQRHLCSAVCGCINNVNLLYNFNKPFKKFKLGNVIQKVKNSLTSKYYSSKNQQGTIII